MKLFALFLVLAALVAGAAMAQEPTLAPTVGALIDPLATPSATPLPPTETPAPESLSATAAPSRPAAGSEDAPAEATIVVSEGSDARLVVCSAPLLPDFMPYMIREGDRLGDLLLGASSLSVMQLAQLNCLDDPTALPVGAVIWIPRPAPGDAGTDMTPEATAGPGSDAGGPSVTRLEADADTVQNQAGTTVRWEATGDAVYFYACPADPDTACERPALAEALPTRHALPLTGFRYSGSARFRLEVVAGGEAATRDLTLNVTCSQEALGATTGQPACPEDPARTVFGAWQPFEGGAMIYFSDTREIYVLTNADGRVQVFADVYEEGMTEADHGQPPDDRYPARRGFGQIWTQVGGPAGRLGWGLAEEIGYDTGRQPAGRLSYTTYVKGPGDVVYAITLVPETRAGYWTQVRG